MNPEDFDKWMPPSPVRPMPMEARRALVIEAAIRWWEANRPSDWSEEFHLTCPEAGTTGREAFLLSDAVASLVSHVRDQHDQKAPAGRAHG